MREEWEEGKEAGREKWIGEERKKEGGKDKGGKERGVQSWKQVNDSLPYTWIQGAIVTSWRRLRR